MKKIIYVVVSVVVMCLLVGCATSIKFTKADPDYKDETKISKNYILNVEQEVTLGNPIISFETNSYRHNQRYKVIKNITTPSIDLVGTAWDLKEGDLFRKCGVTGSNIIIKSVDDNIKIYNTSTLGIEIDTNGYVQRGFINVDKSEIPKQYGQWTKERLFEPTTETFGGSSPFRKELVYVGKDGSNIKVQYREFKDNMIRDAFSLDLRFNLDEEEIIAYKNFKIKVIKATNSTIKYIVLTD